MVPTRESVRQRLTALEATVVGFTAAGPAGGPAHRIAADYAKGGEMAAKKGGAKKGRKVATEKGVKRYGLPIGTPLGQTKSKKKDDPETQRSYATFMDADSPAKQRANAVWMSNDELSRTAEALFSFDSDNERDQSARIVLIRELADRGIDPHTVGYRGGPVVLNPNPKEDPAAKKIRLDQSKADAETRKAESEAAKVQREAEKVAREAEAAAEKADREAKAAAEAAARQRLRDAQARQLLDYNPTNLSRR